MHSLIFVFGMAFAGDVYEDVCRLPEIEKKKKKDLELGIEN